MDTVDRWVEFDWQIDNEKVRDFFAFLSNIRRADMQSIIFAVFMPLIEINPPRINAYLSTTPVLKEQAPSASRSLTPSDGVEMSFRRKVII